MTSCRLQSNYSFTVTLHGGPVELRPVIFSFSLLNKWCVCVLPLSPLSFLILSYFLYLCAAFVVNKRIYI